MLQARPGSSGWCTRRPGQVAQAGAGQAVSGQVAGQAALTVSLSASSMLCAGHCATSLAPGQVKAAQVAQVARVQISQPHCKAKCVSHVLGQDRLEQVRRNCHGTRSVQGCPGCPGRCARTGRAVSVQAHLRVVCAPAGHCFPSPRSGQGGLGATFAQACQALLWHQVKLSCARAGRAVSGAGP